MKFLDVLEGFHPDRMTIDTVMDVWISRARKKHTELICLSRSYAHVLDEADIEGLAVDRARIRIAVGRAARKIRAWQARGRPKELREYATHQRIGKGDDEEASDAPG